MEIQWNNGRVYNVSYSNKFIFHLRSSNHIDIQGRYFHVPSFTPEQKSIPFSRVNHNKYIVTDESALIGTSNWTPDYFLKTGGIGFIFSSQITSNANGGSTEVEPKIQWNTKGLPTKEEYHVDAVEAKEKKEAAISNMHTQLSGVFLRDWNSPYASNNL